MMKVGQRPIFGPVEGAGDAVLDLGQGEHRQGDGAEIERDEVVALEAVAEDLEAGEPDDGDSGRGKRRPGRGCRG